MNKYSQHKCCKTINPLDRSLTIRKAWCLSCNSVYKESEGELKTFEEYLKSLDKNK